MRFLITADTHFGFMINGKVSDHVFNTFEKVIIEAISKNVDYIIIAGDIYNRSKPRSTIKDRANILFEKILSNDMGLILIPGNHDKGDIEHNLDNFFLPNADKFHIINSAEILRFDKIQLFCIPYTKDWPEMNKFDLPTVIIAHHTFHGAVFGPQKYRFTKKRDNAIKVKCVENLKLVISGHIHTTQKLKHEIPVIYTGSLERMSFAEIYDTKGYLILDNLDYEFNEIIPEISMQVIEIDGYKLETKEIIKKIEKQLTDKDRILVRIINRSLKPMEYRAIRSGFDKIIKIIPNNNRILRKLYRNNISDN